MNRITDYEVLERITKGRLLWKSIMKKNLKERIDRIIRPEELLKFVIKGNVEKKNHKRKHRLQ